MLRNVSSTLRQHSTSLRVGGTSSLARNLSTNPFTALHEDTSGGKARNRQQEDSVKQKRSKKPIGDSKDYNDSRERKYAGSTSTAGHVRQRPPYSKDKNGPQFGERKHLLRPPVLLQRLQRLCEEGKFDEAVTALREAPGDAQNTVVWNGLITAVMKARKLQLGYELYIDMKRRGYKATNYTFAAMMKEYRTVDDWKPFSKQLANVHKLFEAWRECVFSHKGTDPMYSNAAAISPLNMYIAVLAKAELYQKMFDVFNEAREHGPIHPDGRTYSELFFRLSERSKTPGGEASIHTQNASDARFLWRQFTKDEEKGLAFADPPLLQHVIRLLARGTATDHLVAFDIIRDYTGLAKPGEEPLKPRVDLSAALLAQILFLTLQSHKPKICLQFVQQVIERPVLGTNGLPILDRHHIRQAISAHCANVTPGSYSESARVVDLLDWSLRQGLENPAYEDLIRPDLYSYGEAFSCMWKSNDWPRAMRIFELMTGYDPEDFRDESLGVPSLPNRTPKKSLSPDNQSCAALARTALESKDRANMRQCLRIFTHFNVGKMIEEGASGGRRESLFRAGEPFSIGVMKNAFYESKLAEVTVDLVEAALEDRLRSKHQKRDTRPPIKVNEERRWIDLRAQAKAAMRSYRHSPKVPRLFLPNTEMQALGSEKGLHAMDKVVAQRQEDRYMSLKPVS